MAQELKVQKSCEVQVSFLLPLVTQFSSQRQLLLLIREYVMLILLSTLNSNFLKILSEMVQVILKAVNLLSSLYGFDGFLVGSLGCIGRQTHQ